MPLSNTKEAKPPLPNSTPVIIKVRNAPINDTGIMETTTSAIRKDSNTTEQIKNISTATNKSSQ